MAQNSLDPKSIERALRLQDYFRNQETSLTSRKQASTPDGKAKPAEEELDVFMDSVTDKKLVEEAKEGWRKKS